MVGFGDCTFVQWDSKGKGLAAIQAQSGTLLVRGCEFRADAKQVELGEKVRRAVVSGNVVSGELRIENHAKGKVAIDSNAAER